ncbi:MAG: response regulator transcription factor [Ignavibacteriales bacterium]|nr:response regulator transcription factor [Ignavibacteriales bacterium]
MKKILLVDDEPDIIEFITYNLKLEKFEVLSASNGAEAIRLLAKKPDLIILDIMMPVMDGYEACKRIRAARGFEQTPIIFLTAKSSEMDEVLGLELGANDFIAKPVSMKKLIARIRTHLRSAAQGDDSQEIAVITAGPLKIDRVRYIVEINGKESVFPRKEFELLYFLAKNPGVVHSRDSLLKSVWGVDVYVVDRTVDVHIRKIREKLDTFADIVETVKGVGYRFKENI